MVVGGGLNISAELQDCNGTFNEVYEQITDGNCTISTKFSTGYPWKNKNLEVERNKEIRLCL